MNKRLITGICCFFLFTAVMAQRTEVLLEKGWKFFRGDISGAAHPGYDDEQWQAVTVPHDWAIYGPFDRDNDLQKVAVTQNFEKTGFGKDRTHRRIALCRRRLVSYHLYRSRPQTGYTGF